MTKTESIMNCNSEHLAVIWSHYFG